MNLKPTLWTVPQCGIFLKGDKDYVLDATLGDRRLKTQLKLL
jgi:hypothetical protein